MKKWVASFLAIIVLVSVLCGCTTTESIATSDQQQAEASGLTIHKIGVATYNVKDAQFQMFKDYLDNYIKGCFSDVTFLYSDSINTSDEMMDFLENCAENGVEGIMSFNTYNLQQEVEYCQSRNMYYIRPSSNSSDADFETVASNPYFVGEIGPGAAREKEACQRMVEVLSEKAPRKSFIILSGGSFMGMAMHMNRTVSMLENLEHTYGVKFNMPLEALAASAQVTTVTAGDVKVTICPGFVELPQFGDPASEAILTGEYDVILSAIPVTPLMDALKASDITCGTTDCFSEDNYFGFKKGKVGFVAGKYQSEIGPAFAALYNAMVGDGEAFRPDGKAFRLEQGYWFASSEAEYDAQYALACGTSVNAYDYNDLYSVIKSITADADYESLKALTESFSYEDCLARRAQ